MTWGRDTARAGVVLLLCALCPAAIVRAETPAVVMPPAAGTLSAGTLALPPDAEAGDGRDRAVRTLATVPVGDLSMGQTAGHQPGRAILRPKARPGPVPNARWAHRPESLRWSRAALSALKGHGKPLVEMVPADIANWCPAYPMAGPDQRRAFWVGFMSALTKHESTYRPEAVGGGGLWYGLLQILPSTARLYNCRARTGTALMNGADNLSCAIRIMARTVPRDGVIHDYSTRFKRRWRGVSADWGPMRSASKRADMAAWLKRQSYCKPMSSVRPRVRPEGLGAVEAGVVKRPG